MNASSFNSEFIPLFISIRAYISTFLHIRMEKLAHENLELKKALFYMFFIALNLKIFNFIGNSKDPNSSITNHFPIITGNITRCLVFDQFPFTSTQNFGSSQDNDSRLKTTHAYVFMFNHLK